MNRILSSSPCRLNIVLSKVIAIAECSRRLEILAKLDGKMPWSGGVQYSFVFYSV